MEMRVGYEDFRAIGIKMVVETVTHLGGSRENVESGRKWLVIQFWETLATPWAKKRADFGGQQILSFQILERCIFLELECVNLSHKPSSAPLT